LRVVFVIILEKELRFFRIIVIFLHQHKNSTELNSMNSKDQALQKSLLKIERLLVAAAASSVAAMAYLFSVSLF
jgi:hypothetical protein